MNQNVKQGIITGLIVIIVAIVVVGLIRTNSDSESEPENVGAGTVEVLGEDALRPDNPDALSTTQGGTREIISEDIETPEVGDASVSEDTAIPVNTSKIKDSALRTFELRGENGKYIPSIIIVDELDPITIKFTSIDDDYNIFFPDFGIYKTVLKGETKDIKFQAYPYGEYQFYCKDVCSGDVTGTLIVNQK